MSLFGSENLFEPAWLSHSHKKNLWIILHLRMIRVVNARFLLGEKHFRNHLEDPRPVNTANTMVKRN